MLVENCSNAGYTIELIFTYPITLFAKCCNENDVTKLTQKQGYLDSITIVIITTISFCVF